MGGGSGGGGRQRAGGGAAVAGGPAARHAGAQPGSVSVAVSCSTRDDLLNLRFRLSYVRLCLFKVSLW